MLVVILAGLGLLYLYERNRRARAGRPRQAPSLSAEQRRLHTRAMLGLLLSAITIIVGVVPALVGVFSLMTPSTSARDRIFWVVVLCLIALGVLAGVAITASARKRLAQEARAAGPSAGPPEE